VTHLRKIMLEELQRRHYSEGTTHYYIRHVDRLNPKSKDPMIGTQDPAKSIFVIPQPNGAPPIKITGFSMFIKTKAAAYCFLPSVTAIKFIATLGAGL
jgi:hypothetical protein